MGEATHFDEQGRARMVDVGAKEVTARRAVAEGEVRLSKETIRRILEGRIPKGDCFAVARLAGVMAAKRTSELVPLCHPVHLTDVEVEIEADEPAGLLKIRAEAKALDRTGVEMEAMTAAAVAGLTLYDMLKGVERGIEVGPIRLVLKEGGKSGTWTRESRDRGMSIRERTIDAMGTLVRLAVRSQGVDRRITDSLAEIGDLLPLDLPGDDYCFVEWLGIFAEAFYEHDIPVEPSEAETMVELAKNVSQLAEAQQAAGPEAFLEQMKRRVAILREQVASELAAKKESLAALRLQEMAAQSVKKLALKIRRFAAEAEIRELSAALDAANSEGEDPPKP